jgi:hypothetical protein
MLLYEGELIWKGYMEYNPRGLIHGTPYYIITQERTRDRSGPYRLLAYNTEAEKYEVMAESHDFRGLADQATALNDVKWKERQRELYGDDYESRYDRLGRWIPPAARSQ